MDPYQLIFGIVVVLALIGVQVGIRRFKLYLAKSAWETGNEAAKREDWPTAEKAFRTCAKQLPMWPAAHTMLGVVLAHQGHLDAAEERFQMAASLEPKNPEGYLGLLYFFATHRPGDMERAAQALEKAFAQDPTLRDKLRDDPRLEKLRRDPALKSLFG